MSKLLKLAIVSVALSAAAAPAHAGEVFGGIYAHAVNTPFSLDSSAESGIDLQLGYRGGAFALGLQPYAFGALNTHGDTSYAAVGLSRKFGDRIFIRPGVGLAIHTGSAAKFENPFNDKIEFGSRILFEPELGVGVRVAPRMTLEASWVHMSHAQLFARQNPGIDNIGARFSLAL